MREVVANWQQILRRMRPVAKGMLNDVTLSVSDSGELIMAFSQATPADFFKKEENKEELIEAAGQLTGREIRVEVRFVENRQELNTFPELRNIIKNVEIEMME